MGVSTLIPTDDYKILYSFETTEVPLETNISYTDQDTIRGFINLIGKLDPKLASFLNQRLGDSRIAQAFGIPAMTTLGNLFLESLKLEHAHPKLIKQAIKLFQVQQGLYIAENITDDIAILERNDLGDYEYKYPTALKDYYTQIVNFINGDLTLRDTLESISVIDTTNIQGIKIIDKIKSLGIPEGTDVVKLSLTLNLLAVATVIQVTNSISAMHPELSDIAAHVRGNLADRYYYSSEMFNSTGQGFSDLMAVASKTILVEFNHNFQLLIAASLDTHTREHAMANNESIKKLHAITSRANRLLNDIGTLVMHPRQAVDKLRNNKKIRAYFEVPINEDDEREKEGKVSRFRNLRDFMNQLLGLNDENFSKEFSRLLNDLRENEANTVLDSDVKSGVDYSSEDQLTLAEAINQLEENLINSQIIFIQDLFEIRKLIMSLGNNFVTRNAAYFLLLEAMIYGRSVEDGGEYINTSKEVISEFSQIIKTEDADSAMKIVIDKLISTVEN
jgi:hypothetical protein